jgi:DEAD/DEAH box helicase domain-containing protein
MSKDLVYFDLETRRTANDVGGWGNKHQMGISIAVTYSTRLEQYLIYEQEESAALIEQLVRADCVIGFNHVGFDYEVLMGQTVLDFRDQVRSFDLLQDLEKRLGHRIKLEDAAAATLGAGKTADGLQALSWWQQGRLLEIAEYCAYDVRATKCLHEYGVQHGHIKYHDRRGAVQTVPVQWEV